MTERHLSDSERKKMDKDYKDWDGKERRTAYNSVVDPYHDKRKK